MEAAFRKMRDDRELRARACRRRASTSAAGWACPISTSPTALAGRLRRHGRRVWTASTSRRRSSPAAAGRQRRRAAQPGDPRHRARRGPPLPGARRGHERPDAPGHVRRLPRHPPGAPREGEPRLRRRRPDLRDRRHLRPRPLLPPLGRRPGRLHERRGLRRGACPASTTPARWSPRCWSTASASRSSAPARPTTTCWPGTWRRTGSRYSYLSLKAPTQGEGLEAIGCRRSDRPARPAPSPRRDSAAAACPPRQHAPGQAREGQRLDPDLARPAQPREEQALAAEQRAAHPAGADEVEIDAGRIGGEAAGIDMQFLARASSRSTTVPPIWTNTQPSPSSFCMMKPSPPNRPVITLRWKAMPIDTPLAAARKRPSGRSACRHSWRASAAGSRPGWARRRPRAPCRAVMREDGGEQALARDEPFARAEQLAHEAAALYRRCRRRTRWSCRRWHPSRPAPASATALSPGSSSISTNCSSCPLISKSISSAMPALRL
jgi:hypothetical protein